MTSVNYISNKLFMMAKPDGESIPLLFEENFLDYHAGQIIQDPRVAIIELVANSWDAGATKVEIRYPEENNDIFFIKDNGTGLTTEEFKLRWNNLHYNRIKHQGKDVTFPSGSKNKKRLAFGKNGVGRHAMFCFCDGYTLETIKDNIYTKASIKRSKSDKPFEIKIEDTKPKKGHGTTISGRILKNNELREQSIVDLIGSKFVADPEFTIIVNTTKVDLMDLNAQNIIKEFPYENLGKVIIRRFEGEKYKTTQQQGVAWWVQRRLVGTPSWDGVNGRLIDGRNPIAKKYVYVIEADFLKPFVKQDWSGFHANSDIKNQTRYIRLY